MKSTASLAVILCVVISVPLAASKGGVADEPPILLIENGAHTSKVRWLCFTPDGQTLVSAGDDKTVRIWDVSTPSRPRLTRTLRFQIGPGSEGEIFGGALSPDGRMVALCGYFDRSGRPSIGDIRLVDLQSGKILKVLKGHAEPLLCLAFSSDGRILASGGYDKTVRIWDLGPNIDRSDWSSAPDSVALVGHTDAIHGLSFAFTQRLLSASSDHTLRLWERQPTGDWSCKVVMTGHADEVRGVACSPDGHYAASCSIDRTVRLWDCRSGELLRTLGKHNNAADVVAFSPDGMKVVSGGGGDGSDRSCRVWSVQDGGQIAEFDGHDNTVMCADFSPSGKLVASTGGNNQDIYLWSPATGLAVGNITGSGRSVWATAFSNDGRQVAFGNANKGGAIRANNPLQKVFNFTDITPAPVVDLATVMCQRGPLTHENLAAQRVDSKMNCLSVQRDGREIFQISRQRRYDRINCYAFTSTGDVVVGSSFILKLYDGRDGKLKNNFVGHTGEVWSAAISPDGRLLLTGSVDQTFRFWNINSGELLLSAFVGIDDEWVVWTPQGYFKSSKGGDKLLGWHVNRGNDQPAQFVYARDLHGRFERADIVERVLKTGSVAEAERLADAEPRLPH